MRNQVQRHAPYLYLTRSQQVGSFALYIAIPIKENYEEFEHANAVPVYRDGQTVIDIKLRAGAATAATVINKKIILNPQGEHFNRDTDEILVNVIVYHDENTIEEKFYSIMLYRDCDSQPVVDEVGDQGNIAYNCPYTFLQQINGQDSASAQATTSPWAFHPYLLLSLKGYSIHPDQIAITTPTNGVYETIIVLSKIETNGSEGSFMHDFNANRAIYYDSGRVEGNFTATVVREDGIVESESLIGKNLTEIHQVLANMDSDNGNANGEAVAAAGSGNGASSNGAAARNAEKREKNTAVTRNMSSRRQSPIFLDFQAAEEVA